MEPIFTLPYSEHQAIEQIVRKLKKSDGYAVYVPTSRQQKGVDFVIHNAKTNKFARVQVKSSRTFTHANDGCHYLWYNNFIEKYEKGNADFYILFGLYPEYSNKSGIKRGKFWKPITLCFAEKEMFNFLKKVKTKKEQKADRFFAFGFFTPNDIFCSRGPNEYQVTEHLLENQIDDIKKFLK